MGDIYKGGGSVCVLEGSCWDGKKLFLIHINVYVCLYIYIWCRGVGCHGIIEGWCRNDSQFRVYEHVCVYIYICIRLP